LLKAGLTDEQLARVHAPIGLDLGAETPDEIALSIAAELLAWRRAGSGIPLRDRQGILASLLDGGARQTANADTGDKAIAATASAVAEQAHS